MTRLWLKPENQALAVELLLERGNDSGWKVMLGGKTYDVQHELIPGGGVLQIGQEVYPYYAFRGQNAVHLWVGGKSYRIELSGKSSHRDAAPSAPREGSFDVPAPMPGRILDIRVKVEDRVNAGEVLLVMESMKMEMAISAPHPGTVRSVLCGTGDLVEMGQKLLVLQSHG